MKVCNGELKDLSFSINKDAEVKIITKKDKEGLKLLDMMLLISWQWQFKSYFQAHK